MSRIYNIARSMSFTYNNNRIKFSGTNFFFDKVFLLIVFHFEEGLFSYCGNSQRTFTGLGKSLKMYFATVHHLMQIFRKDES